MSFSSLKPPLWKQILRQNFIKLDQLADFLELSSEQRSQLIQRRSFPLNLPLRLAQKMQKGTLDDPLFRQFVPLAAEEALQQSNFVSDPVGDVHFRRSAKLLHKYEGRVLLVATGACAMHCRYCFRQNFDYETKEKGFEQELMLIGQDPSIHEVILSGGDPLSLSDETLAHLLQRLNELPFIKRIRFHTRFPIGIPERIDEHFLSTIAQLSKQVWFIIHCNHARELDEAILSRLKELQKLGCTLLCQSVLLKGVNDDVATLKGLCETLVDHGIFPYYLHQLDRVQGAQHFEVSEIQGRLLIEELAKCLPGYAIPKYVREIAGELNKTPIL